MKKEIKAASKMWKDGKSSVKIAAALGVPRNTVLQWSGRHRELFPRRTASELAVIGGRNAKIARESQRRARTHAKFFGPVHDTIGDDEFDALEIKIASNFQKRVAGAFQPIATSRPARLAECDGCRWPVDDVHGAAALFCNAERPMGQPYCTAHRAMSGSRLEMV